MNGEDHMGDGAIWIGAIVLGVIAYFLTRLVDRMFRPHPPRDMMRWRDDVEQKCINAIHASFYAVEAEAILMESIGQIPKEFDSTVFLTMQVAQGVHKAVLAEAERLGLIKPGIAARMYSEAVAAPLGANGAPSVPPPAVETKPAEPTMDFVEGRLVPKVGGSP